MLKRTCKRVIAIILSVLIFIVGLPVSASAAEATQTEFKAKLSVLGKDLHLQGYAVDQAKQYMYWSFTNYLVKTDMNGNVIKAVNVPGGHLGDLTCYDGKVYGSFLGDPRSGDAWNAWTSFNIKIFNADDLSVIQTVSAPDPFDTWKGNTSGSPIDGLATGAVDAIDGIAFGKDPEGNNKFMIACSVPTGEAHTKQVILQYSLDLKYEKFYTFETGNTPYGIQTLEYDKDTGDWWFTTYAPNETYQTKDTLYKISKDMKTILGKWNYPTYYGLASLGNNKFYVADNTVSGGLHTGIASLATYDATNGMVKGRVTGEAMPSILYFNMDGNRLVQEGNARLKDVTGELTANIENVMAVENKDGVADSALHFDGTSSVSVGAATISEINDAVANTNAIALSTWVKIDADASINGDDFMYIAGVTDPAGKYTMTLELSGWGNLVLHGTAVDTQKVNENEVWYLGNKLQTDIWYHLTATYSGGFLGLYVNGVKVTEVNIPGKVPDKVPTIGNITVGTEPVAGAESLPSYQHKVIGLKGSVDDVRVYTDVLSAEQIAAIANGTEGADKPAAFVKYNMDAADIQVSDVTETKMLDLSGNKMHGIVTGPVSLTTDKDGNANSALQLTDGAQIKLDATSIAKLDGLIDKEFTLSLWAKRTGDYLWTTNTAGTQFGYVAGISDAAGKFLSSIEYRYNTLVYNSDIGGTELASYPNKTDGKNHDYIDNLWHNIVVTYDNSGSNGEMIMYIDGVKQTTHLWKKGDYSIEGIVDFTIGTATAAAKAAHGGGKGAGNRSFIGAIDDVYIFNRALIQSEVDKLLAKEGKPVLPADPEPPKPVTNSSVWTANWREQIFKDTNEPVGASKGITLDVAKNEYEPAQIVVRANGAYSINGVDFTDLTSGSNVIAASNLRYNYVNYFTAKQNTQTLTDVVRAAPADFPEMLSNERTISIKADNTQPIWVKAYIPKETEAGTYTGVATVKTSFGDFPVNITVNVYDVTMPDSEDGAFTFEFWNQLVKCFEDTGKNDFDVIKYGYGIDAYSTQWWELMEKYAAFMKENRMNSLFLNVIDLLADGGSTVAADGTVTFDWTLLDEFVEFFIEKGGTKLISAEHLYAQDRSGEELAFKVEVLMNENGKTVKGYKKMDEGGKKYLEQYLTALNTHLDDKGWRDIWHQHIGDEPTYGDMPRLYKEASAMVREYVPGVSIGDAMYTDNISEFEGAMDLWIPMTSVYEGFRQNYLDRQAAGDEVWMYTAMYPTGNYLNRFVDSHLYKMELLGWLSYKYGVTGYLHWGLMEWGVWEEMDVNDTTVGPHNSKYLGDAWSIYPDKNNMDIISSLRVESAREAFEDYELLKIYETKDKAAANLLVDVLVKDSLNYTKDINTIQQRRTDLLAGAAGEYVAPKIIANKVTAKMDIDGKLAEVEWDANKNLAYSEGSSDNTAKAGILYDEDNLYVAVEVEDNNLINANSSVDGNSAPYMDDSVAIYIDGNNNKGSYDSKTAQYVFRWNDETPYVYGNANASTDGVKFKMVPTEKGYTLEAAIPWSAVNGLIVASKNTIGFTIDVNDKDVDSSSADVAGIISLNEGADHALTSSRWSDLYLSDVVVTPPPPFTINYATGISIDGVIDEGQWDLNKPLDIVTFGMPNNTAKFGLLWDDENLYAAFNVKDDVVLDSGSSDCWNEDSIELFVDFDLIKNSFTPQTPGIGQFTFVVDRDEVYLRGFSYQPDFAVDVRKIKHKMVRTATGYTMEIAVPWEILSEDGVAAGKKVGVTAQMNDKDINDVNADSTSGLAYYSITPANVKSSVNWPEFELIGGSDVVRDTIKINEIKFADINGNEVTSLNNGGYINASLKLQNISKTSQNALVIVALYDAQGTMKNVAFANKSMLADETIELGGGFNLPSDTTGHQIKVFVWDGWNTMKPLAAEVIFPTK